MNTNTLSTSFTHFVRSLLERVKALELVWGQLALFYQVRKCPHQIHFI